MNQMLRGLKFCGTSVMVLGGKKESVTRAVIFLHGSGDSGLGMATWLKQLGYSPDPDIVLIIPSAPLRPYTLAGGEKSAVWHDRKELNIDAWEDKDGIGAMAQSLEKLVTEVAEVTRLERSKVALGGFSQGGHMALQAVYGHVGFYVQLLITQ